MLLLLAAAIFGDHPLNTTTEQTLEQVISLLDQVGIAETQPDCAMSQFAIGQYLFQTADNG